MRVIIESSGTGKVIRLYFLLEDQGGRESLAHVREDGVLEFSPVKEDGDDIPTMKIDGRIAGPLFVALAEALSSRGVRTDSDAKLIGTLEATRAHLADLQALLHIGGKP